MAYYMYIGVVKLIFIANAGHTEISSVLLALQLISFANYINVVKALTLLH